MANLSPEKNAIAAAITRHGNISPASFNPREITHLRKPSGDAITPIHFWRTVHGLPPQAGRVAIYGMHELPGADDPNGMRTHESDWGVLMREPAGEKELAHAHDVCESRGIMNFSIARVVELLEPLTDMEQVLVSTGVSKVFVPEQPAAKLVVF